MSTNETTARFRNEVMPHFESAYNLARWITGNAADADDILQEAALRALRAADTFEEGKAKPWLLQIVRNTAYTWMKKRRDFVELSENAISSESSPESVLISKTSAKDLHTAIENLPAEFREVLILRELEDLSYREIADITGLPDGTVMSRLSRARAQLKKQLIQDGRSR